VKPIFKIEADDQDITDLLTTRLISLNISDETGFASDKAEILLDNRDHVLDIPARGTLLKIYLGYQGRALDSDNKLSFMGSFTVDNISLSSPGQLRIVAKASYAKSKGLSNKIRSPKSKSWHKTNLGFIIQRIAFDNKFIALTDPYFSQIYIPHIDQTSQSDLSFLVDLAQNHDALFKFIDGKLVFARKSTGISVTGKLIATIQILENQISSWKLDILDRAKFGKIIAKYQNIETAKEKKVTIGNEEPAYEMRFTFPNEEIATNSAKAKLAQQSRGVSQIELTIVGNPKLSTEGKISIPDIRYLKDSQWIITSITHDLSSQGYKSTIRATDKI
jgi:phage protein D